MRYKQRKAGTLFIWYSDNVDKWLDIPLLMVTSLAEGRRITPSPFCVERYERGGGYPVILKMCARCKATVVYPATYCESCQSIVVKEREERAQTTKKQYNKRYNSKRDPKYAQFYNSPAWRALSAKTMQDNEYRCKDCGAIATQVHHEKEISTPEGWEERFNAKGLACLCDRCHNKRHDRFVARGTTSLKPRRGH